jgi:hypothetical protein
MPSDSSNEVNEVVVVMPEGSSSTPAANPAEASTPAESEPVVVEVFDAILDPFGSHDSTDPAPEGVVEEVFVVEPAVDSSATGGEGTATDPADGSTTPAADTGQEGGLEPATDSPETGETSTTPDPTDSPATGSDDPTTGVAGSDPDATTQSSTDTTDPDAQSGALNDAQQNLQQDEQSEGQAAASGDYATAQDDAQQAYSASQDVANAGGPDNTNETWEAAQNESWANWDQQTANEDAQTAQSYANDPTGNPANDAADEQMYAAAADNAQENADDHGEAGEYGDALGPQDDSSAAAEETPVDDTPVEDSAPVDDSAPSVDDDSST